MRSVTVRMMSWMAVAAFAVMGWTGQAAAENGDVYTLKTCPVSGKALGDEPVVKQIEGREVRFCCGGCPAKAEAEPAKYMAKIDEQIVEEQGSDYALETCIMSGRPLGEDAVAFVVDNQLVKTCCGNCEEGFKKDAEANLAKLDKAIIEAESENYAAKTCPVSGEELGSMGEPVNVVTGGHLVKLCCAGCEKPLAKEPTKYLSKLESDN